MNYIRIGYRLNVFFFTQMMLGTTHLHKIFKIKIKENSHSIVFGMDNLYEILFGKHTVENALINIGDVAVVCNNEDGSCSTLVWLARNTCTAREPYKQYSWRLQTILVGIAGNTWRVCESYSRALWTEPDGIACDRRQDCLWPGRTLLVVVTDF